MNASDLFPMRFYPTQWTENEDVAARALVVWNSVFAVIEHFSKQCPSKGPQNNSSYDALAIHHKDSFMPVKFQIFKDIAGKMNLYLKLFQTDSPMIPFLSDVLEAFATYHGIFCPERCSFRSSNTI